MRTRVRGLLVAGQMGFAVVLLATAGVFMHALSSTRNLETGWDADGVWTVDLDLELTGTSPGDGRILFDELTRTLAEAPGVQSVGLTHSLPLRGRSVADVTVDGLEPREGRGGVEASYNRVSPGYFRTMEIALLRGRVFTHADVEGAPPVAVVNRTMAARLWGDTDPIGKTFRISTVRGGGDGVLLSVVGVVEDAIYGSLSEVAPNAYYLPSGQWYTAHRTLLIRPEPGQADEVSERVSSLIATLEPALPRQPMTPLPATLSLAFAPQRMAAWTSGIIGLLALLLGAVGVYGVTAFTVGQRIREIGIRMALGATRRDVIGLVLGQGMIAPTLGLLLGLVGASVAPRLIGGFMPGVAGTDPAIFVAAAATLVFVALVATFMPAWRAVRSNPVKSLGTE
jgi:predicted permease